MCRKITEFLDTIDCVFTALRYASAVIAKFHYTDPTRTRHGPDPTRTKSAHIVGDELNSTTRTRTRTRHGPDNVRGLCLCPVRVVSV